MIKVNRRQLLELATVYMVANTPASLFRGLLRNDVVSSLMSDTPRAQLLAYFDQITARAKRNEFTLALAYGVLVAIICSRDRSNWEENPDVDRLSWGSKIFDIASKSRSVNSVQEIQMPTYADSGEVRTSGSILILNI